jgi:hypothetical protein
VIANVAVARELAGWCWSLAARPPASPQMSDQRSDGDRSAWSDPRLNYEQPLSLARR